MYSTYLGPTFRYLNAEISTQFPLDALSEPTVPFNIFGVGPTLEYDTRDNLWWPTTGVYARGEALWYGYEGSSRSLSFNQSFVVTDVSIAHYLGVSDKAILAGEVRAATASDDAPFFMNPFVSIRGFPSGKYLDAAVIQAQGELRWTLWKKLGVVAFGGIGATGPGVGSFDAIAVGFGGGVRYRISEIDRMNIGFDIAYGDGHPALYFSIGEAF